MMRAILKEWSRYSASVYINWLMQSSHNYPAFRAARGTAVEEEEEWKKEAGEEEEDEEEEEKRRGMATEMKDPLISFKTDRKFPLKNSQCEGKREREKKGASRWSGDEKPGRESNLILRGGT